ncbi:TPA: hypothetical protein DCY65_02360 [Candidatus Acetothermia bacterium]|nr:hypothetical protein [Candidatus Acetothermia bacterium]HAZ30397.1 hypothetical protein [Candidatus Acetothermia bacterium]
MGIHKGRAEFLLLAVLLGLGLGLRQPALAFLALPVAVHLVGAFALAAGDSPRLSAKRTLSAFRLWEGETVEVTVIVENRGRRVEVVHVQDLLPSGAERVDGQAERVAELGAGAQVSLQYVAQVRRGLYSFPAVRIAAQDLLGYATWHTDTPCPASLAVLPRFERLSGISIAPRRTLPQAGTARSRRSGSGIEFFGAREYRPGDDIRRVNWKASARVDELVVVELEEERAADVAVVLDVRDRAYQGPHSLDLLDHAARGAAGLCQAFLSQGHRVALLMYGVYVDWACPGYGHRHAERLLRELARAKPGTSEVFSGLGRLPTALLRPGSQVALVSPLILGDEEDLGMLTARGYRVMALVPDVATMERGSLGEGPEVELAVRILGLERWAMLQRLHAARANPLLWDVRYPLAPQAKAAWRRAR